MWRTVIALLVATTIAHADTDGDAALAKIDSAMGAVVFVSSTWDIKSSQSKHNAKHQAMTIMAKGDKVYAELDDVPSAGLLTRFLSSATDTSGMRFMQPGINDGEPRSADRRMLLDNGATLKEVAFSPDDWSLVAFATSYVATLAPANTGEVALVLVPRPAAQQSGIEKIELVAKAARTCRSRSSGMRAASSCDPTTAPITSVTRLGAWPGLARS
jgi:hypothetical protein